MLDLLERLINEHGSSTILKERLLVVQDAYSDVEKRNSNLQLENAELKAEVAQLKRQNEALKSSLKALEGRSATIACDHCGSTQLKRTGNRPDPTFKMLGIKQQVFTCLDCGQESAFTPEE